MDWDMYNFTWTIDLNDYLQITHAYVNNDSKSSEESNATLGLVDPFEDDDLAS